MEYVKPEMNVFVKDELEAMVEANAASGWDGYNGYQIGACMWYGGYSMAHYACWNGSVTGYGR